MNRPAPVAASLLLRFVFVGLSFSSTVLASRYLGLAQFGVFSLLLSLSLLVVGLSQAGGVQFLVRETARSNDVRHHRVLLVRVTILSVSAALLMSSVVEWKFMDYSGPSGSVALIAVASILTAFLGATARGSSLIVWGQIPDSLIRPLLFIAGILMLAAFRVKASAVLLLWLYAGAATVTAIISLAVAVVALRRRNATAFFPAGRARSWRRGVAKLAVVGWAGSAGLYLPPILAAAFGSTSDAGLLRIAIQFAAFSLLGLAAVELAQAPAFAAAGSNDVELLSSLLRRSCRVASLFAVVAGLVSAIAVSPIVNLLLPAEYGAVVPAVLILLGGQAVNAMTGNVGTLLIACDLERQVLAATLASLLCLVFLSAVLVPHYGLIGAAVAQAVTLASRNLLNAITVWRKFGILALPVGGLR